MEPLKTDTTIVTDPDIDSIELVDSMMSLEDDEKLLTEAITRFEKRRAPLYQGKKRRPIFAGNWKMYKTAADTRVFFETFRALVAGTLNREIVICPPFPNIAGARALARDTEIAIGAQNVFWAKEGAYTGEVSADMLTSLGCRWVIIGHSERRQYFGETDLTVSLRIGAALDAGLTPIICLGEALEEREAGQAHAVLEKQFEGGLASLTLDEFATVVIAYEPAWAIGTGKTATPAMAAESHAVIRKLISGRFGEGAAAQCRILYGGSVNPDNIQALMAEDEIDGALVGGASLDPVSFASIVTF